MHACVLVLDHGQFVDLSKLLKDRLEVLLLQIARDLADEELDGVRLLHWGRRRRCDSASSFTRSDVSQSFPLGGKSLWVKKRYEGI